MELFFLKIIFNQNGILARTGQLENKRIRRLQIPIQMHKI